jgi:hypothetical protein
VGEFARRGWKTPPSIDRVQVSARPQHGPGRPPPHDFATVIARVKAGEDLQGRLALLVGARGRHAETFAVGAYPTA